MHTYTTQVPCRLAVTPSSLIERHAQTYLVASRRPLAAVASFARFVEVQLSLQLNFIQLNSMYAV
jgi:hypothetical protein